MLRPSTNPTFSKRIFQRLIDWTQRGTAEYKPSDAEGPTLRDCRGQWDNGHRAAKQCDERAAGAHSITSSARASSVAGTSRPSAFAVFWLITSSNLVGCPTGKSAGLAPLMILSTYVAPRRYKSG